MMFIAVRQPDLEFATSIDLEVTPISAPASEIAPKGCKNHKGLALSLS
jgi:hypothetical protein